VTVGEFEYSQDPVNTSGNKIEKRVWIKASPEVVYRALTNTKDLTKWFCDEAHCSLPEGRELVAVWKSGKNVHKGRGVFTHVEPGSRLELLWIEDGSDTPSVAARHTLSYAVKSKSGMTEVVMVDKDDAALDEETYAVLDQGWNSVLLELKDFCERRERSLKFHPVPDSCTAGKPH
jgi:uncharacterized protein YndB with AHSA1/START domain